MRINKKIKPAFRIKAGGIDMATFKERLWELFEEEKDRDFKCTRADFAAQCGITSGQLAGYLQGNGTKFCQILSRIANNKKVSAAWLIGLSDERLGESSSLNNMISKLSPQDLHTIQLLVEFMHERSRYSEYNKRKHKK